jgi:inner membrane protein
MLAGLSHLPADIVFNGGTGLSVWPVPLLWPFSQQGWALPIVPWGEVTVTVLFIGEMFALYRWPRRDRVIAALTLAAGSAYLLARGLWTGFGG